MNDYFVLVASALDDVVISILLCHVHDWRNGRLTYILCDQNRTNQDFFNTYCISCQHANRALFI
jgi:hypothetical protein